MATSYTSLLGFALPVTGELSGTWGDTVNDSITKLVEDSIAGVATASVASGDWTLSTTGSGAANEARCAILRPTGSSGVARNIIAPSSSKAYIVDNQSNVTVTVKGAATVGTAVPAGVDALVVWTGSDFATVASSAAKVDSISFGTTGLTPSTATTGAVTVAGTLAVANGGTGATTAPNARTNLGATTVGSNLFTLTNPSAVTFPRFNADNTVSALDAATFRTAIGAGTGGGTVTSVSGTGTASGLTLSGTVTTSGSLTLSGTVNSLAAGTYGISISGTASNITSYTINQSVGTGNNVQFNSLGVGTGASGTTGEIRATNNITAYYSDDRLKTKLGDIENALDKLCTLSGFYYEANQTAQELGYEPVREVGVSAQSVQKVLPEVVVPAPIDDKYLTVRYEKLIPLVIEAIKELRAEVKALKGE